MVAMMRTWAFAAALVLVASCGGRQILDLPATTGAAAGASGGVGTGSAGMFGGAGETGVAGASGAAGAADSRCGSVPRMLVDASSYPVTPGAVTIGVSALAVDGLDLYYVLGESGTPTSGPDIIVPIKAGAVMRVPTVGGRPIQVAGGYSFSAPLFTATSMILGESTIDGLGVDDGAIVSIPRDGGPQTTLVNPGTRDSLLPLSDQSPLTDGTFVYYPSENGVEAALASTDSPGTQPTLLTSESPFAMGISGQRLLLSTAEEVKSLPLGVGDAGTETTLATGLPDGAMAEAPCGSNACWLSEPFVSLLQIDLAGDPPKTINLGSSFSSALNMVSDGETVFIEGGAYDSPFPTTIVSLSNDGVPSLPIVSMPQGSRALAVDDACLYFSTSAGIFSVVRTAVGARVP